MIDYIIRIWNVYPFVRPWLIIIAIQVILLGYLYTSDWIGNYRREKARKESWERFLEKYPNGFEDMVKHHGPEQSPLDYLLKLVTKKKVSK